MSRVLLAVIMAGMLGACAHAAAPDGGASDTSPPAPAVAGGWSAADRASAEVAAAADYAAHMLNRGGATVASIDSASQQVVAGMNYRLDLTLSDGSRWRVTVWRKLDAGMEMTAASGL